MEPHQHSQDPTPPGSFRLEELEAFQSIEGEILADVNYFLWLNQTTEGQAPYRFLYFLELIFEDGATLLLSSGEDSEAIRVSSPETLLKTAEALKKLHNAITIQRLSAGNLPFWQAVVGKTLQAVQLSKDEEGLYYNDALVLDFGEKRIMIHLSEKEGLELGSV